MVRVHCASATGSTVVMSESHRRIALDVLKSDCPTTESKRVTLLDPSSSLVIEEPYLTLERRIRNIERSRSTRLRRVAVGSDRDVFRGLVVDSAALAQSSGPWIPHEVAIAAWSRLHFPDGRKRPLVVVWSVDSRMTVVVSRRGVLDVAASLGVRRRLATKSVSAEDRRLYLGDLETADVVRLAGARGLNPWDQAAVGACLAVRLPGTVVLSRSSVVSTNRRQHTLRMVVVAALSSSLGVSALAYVRAEGKRSELSAERDTLRRNLEQAVLQSTGGRGR